jgi:beta-glucanase (GH16 family)
MDVKIKYLFLNLLLGGLVLTTSCKQFSLSSLTVVSPSVKKGISTMKAETLADGSDIGQSESSFETVAPPSSHGTLIFNDEFSGSQLDATYWETQYRWGRTNEPELQYYSADALKVSDGILRIVANRHQMDDMEYTSAMIASYDKFTFTYGYLEMRARIPSGQGLWPAFWLHLNNDDKSGEIDVFEFLGHEPNIIHMSYHYPKLSEYWFNGPDFSQDYHLYAIDWQPDGIVWYVDGIERARATVDIPGEPMYIIVNLAIGGPWPGNPDDSTNFPAYYDIDYIRVYQD